MDCRALTRDFDERAPVRDKNWGDGRGPDVFLTWGASKTVRAGIQGLTGEQDASACSKTISIFNTDLLTFERNPC
jgi:hypothetical protein